MGYLALIEQHSWSLEFNLHVNERHTFAEKFVMCCTEIFYRYITRDDINETGVVRVMARVPHCIAAELVIMTSKKIRGEGNRNGNAAEVAE